VTRERRIAAAVERLAPLRERDDPLVANFILRALKTPPYSSASSVARAAEPRALHRATD
jgi:hypothetical protein